jgi:hypothetical protein
MRMDFLFLVMAVAEVGQNTAILPIALPESSFINCYCKPSRANTYCSISYSIYRLWNVIVYDYAC